MKEIIIQSFKELKDEAKLGEVKIIDDFDTRIIRILFNIVDELELLNMPNLYIKNKDSFYRTLTEYVYKALKFYKLNETKDNIKIILSFLFINITDKEMSNIENYVRKYINFLDDKLLSNKYGEKNTELGEIKYEVCMQGYQQETPYCFKSRFQKGDSEYFMPRISFGISEGICYIYAIQNKDKKTNIDSQFNLEVKEKLRTINSGISKYRNVTPSFVVALALFISFLKENNINKVKVVTPLPIRQKNRDLSAEYKIKFYSMSGNLEKEQIEILKNEIENKKLNDDYNSTIKFVNCFNRLKLHFDNIFLGQLNKEETLEIINLITQNEFLKEVVKEKER